jgi:hypothetical protein
MDRDLALNAHQRAQLYLAIGCAEFQLKEEIILL